MDLNSRYRRQQVAIYSAQNATCNRLRQAPRWMPEAYAALIAVPKNEHPSSLC